MSGFFRSKKEKMKPLIDRLKKSLRKHKAEYLDSSHFYNTGNINFTCHRSMIYRKARQLFKADPKLNHILVVVHPHIATYGNARNEVLMYKIGKVNGGFKARDACYCEYFFISRGWFGTFI